jgi:hypothetical protein
MLFIEIIMEIRGKLQKVQRQIAVALGMVQQKIIK